MGEDRHPRLGLHPADQVLAAARHDHVDGAIEAGEHHADRVAVAGRDERDRRGGQPGFDQALDHRGMDRAARAEALGAAAQDRRIAGLEAERAGIRGDIGPALVDHADDAERHPHALDAHAVGPPPRRHDGADRILELADHIEAGRHGLDALGIERQPIEEGRRCAAGFRLGPIFRIGGEDRRARAADGLGHCRQRPVLLRGRRERQRARRLARLAADLAHRAASVAPGFSEPATALSGAFMAPSWH